MLFPLRITPLLRSDRKMGKTITRRNTSKTFRMTHPKGGDYYAGGIARGSVADLRNTLAARHGLRPLQVILVPVRD